MALILPLDRSNSAPSARAAWSTVVLALLTVAGCGWGGAPNRNVADFNFDRIQVGMAESDLDVILGKPHRETTGIVVRREQAASADQSYTLNIDVPSPEGHAVLIYDGLDEESIHVLLSGGRNRNVVAVEYCIGDRPVLYKGLKRQTIGAQMVAGAIPRAAGEAAELDARIARFHERRRQMALAGQPIPPPAPADTPATAPNTSDPAVAPGADSAPAAPAADSSVPTPETMPAPADANPGPMDPAPDPAAANPPEPAPPPERTNSPGELKIALPGGEILSEDTFKLADDWRQRTFPPENPVVVSRTETGVRGLMATAKGKADGGFLLIHRNRALAALGTLQNGLLEGPLRLWDKQQHRQVFAEFSRGQKQGLVCYFEDDRPRLVQKWTKGELQAAYLLKYDGKKPLIAAVTDLTGQYAADAQAAAEKVEGLLAGVAENQTRLKVDGTRWAKAEIDRLRREKMAAIKPIKTPPGRVPDPSKAPPPSEDWSQVLQNAWEFPFEP